MHRTFASGLLICATCLVAPLSASAVTIAWTPVGNPGNAADTTDYGAVNHSYNIGTYDVTNSQYVAFLNSNDPTGADPLALFNSNMSSSRNGGINFNSGAPAGSMYSVVSGKGNNPVNFVTWYDAIRFANWMDNMQPVFGTEPTSGKNATDNGAYTLDGFEPTPSNGNSITRNAGATIFLPNENEWYKAAYYNPTGGSYYLYPTSSSSTPNASGPTSTPNSANYNNAVGNLTAVGDYSGTTSPYGAFDMGGDVFQWNEALIAGSFRGVRGGAFLYDAGLMQSSFRLDSGFSIPTDENNGIGFRVASVPEPSTGLLAVLACVLMWWKRMSLRRVA